LHASVLCTRFKRLSHTLAYTHAKEHKLKNTRL
jgi:hypothetical protein